LSPLPAFFPFARGTTVKVPSYNCGTLLLDKRRVETTLMRIFQPIMLVCAVAMSFVGALGLPGCARAIGECLRDRPEPV
jgi:hypothetical protein